MVLEGYVVLRGTASTALCYRADRPACRRKFVSHSSRESICNSQIASQFLIAVFFASAMTASNAGFGWLLPSNKRGLPLARQEFASFAPQNVTIFTESRCFRNARKIPA